jgi:hypothetical protein
MRRKAHPPPLNRLMQAAPRERSAAIARVKHEQTSTSNR